ncbi:THO complex subunit 4-like [Paramacrobiotus metropolitanus]|uniref:THO complex subunit 4-like n=1 Tax=Paramacrobiotus metropolitanus TaxID=2943436 RepID=UPI002446154B|nr:THO complex subunit 4-like [Paramacrobiotus metropolitanus]
MADVALDDYIKTKRITRSGRGGRGGAAGGRGGKSRGTSRQSTGLRGARGGITKGTRGARKGVASYGRSNVGGGERWQHDLYGGAGAGGVRSRTGAAGTKLLISNLDFAVSDKDIHDLFKEFGAIKRAAVHYDRSGRSIGTAEVIYIRSSDAVSALKRYNDVPLDGRPMDIQLVTSGVGASANGAGAPRRRGTGRVGGGSQGAVRGRGARAGGTSTRGGRGRRGARGGGRGRGAKPDVTQAQLDMELDEYQSSANKSA